MGQFEKVQEYKGGRNRPRTGTDLRHSHTKNRGQRERRTPRTEATKKVRVLREENRPRRKQAGHPHESKPRNLETERRGIALREGGPETQDRPKQLRRWRVQKKGEEDRPRRKQAQAPT